MTWKLFSSQISVKDIKIERKIDEYFDNTNSSDDNEEDYIGEAGRRNEIVRRWYNDEDDDPDKNVIREDHINPDAKHKISS